jgi:predicted transport protein
LRPDSIAFDNDRNSFVIIEYKNVKHKGVVDQGMSYYKLLDDKKENFVLLYHKIKGKILDTDKDVNWDETRIIFISPEFTEHQKRASQSINLPIELYEISKFDNGIILLDKIENKKDVSIKGKSKTVSINRLNEYSEEDYLAGKYYRGGTPTDTGIKLFKILKNKILERFSDVEIKQKSRYAGFYSKKDGSALCTIVAVRNYLEVSYAIRVKDALPKSDFVRYMVKPNGKKLGHWGLGDYLSKVIDEKDIEKAFPLIEKVYDIKFNEI